jgi:hypothetical protein
LALCLCLAPLAGCKQGEGEICQINDDCEDGLDCNAGTMRCQKPGSAVVDAAPPADAFQAADADTTDADTTDADTTDAGVDAGIDAS